MWETIREYLTFTRKERFGVLFLIVLICILFLLPFLFRSAPGDPDPEAYKKLKVEIRKFESRADDSTETASRHDRYRERERPSAETKNEVETYRGGLFYFDPNNLQVKDWQRLGISLRLAQTVAHYIERGGRFRKAEDLKKLYGLSRSDYERLFPYVRIAVSGKNKNKSSADTIKTGHPSSSVNQTDVLLYKNKWKNQEPGSQQAKKSGITDINLADSADWCRLPGIGEKLASRIIRFRNKLGGFYRIEQVAETFGLPDSSFQKIKTCLVISSISLHQIDLNHATREVLQAHPYIRWQIARGIVEYRDQHAGFRSVDEILQLAQMDSGKFEKLKPYLTLGSAGN